MKIATQEMQDSEPAQPVSNVELFAGLVAVLAPPLAEGAGVESPAARWGVVAVASIAALKLITGAMRSST